ASANDTLGAVLLCDVNDGSCHRERALGKTAVLENSPGALPQSCLCARNHLAVSVDGSRSDIDAFFGVGNVRLGVDTWVLQIDDRLAFLVELFRLGRGSDGVVQRAEENKSVGFSLSLGQLALHPLCRVRPAICRS